MTRARSLARGLAIIAAFAALFIVIRTTSFAQSNDRGVLADLISKALSSPGSSVSVGAIDGALSSDATIRDITITDRNGIWLRVDRVRLIWTRSALLLRRLEVNKLEIGKLEILRKPVPTPGAAPPKNDEPLLPELPLKVKVEDFQLGELSLGEPLVGVAARFAASGAASLGPPSEGLDFRFDGKRLDSPGLLGARLSYVPDSKALTTAFKVDEPSGGFISRVANLPGQPPVKLDLDGKGTLDNFLARLIFNAGDEIGADGTATLGRVGAGRQLSLDLSSRIEGLMPPVIGPVFAGTTKLTGNLGFADDGGFDIRNLSFASQIAQLDINGRYGADQMVDFKMTAAAVPSADGKTRAGVSEIGKLRFEGSVVGPLKGPTVKAVLALADANVPTGRIGALDATFNATPTGPYDDPNTRLRLEADGKTAGLVLTDKRLDAAIGERVTFTLRGVVSTDGVADFRTVKLTAAGAELTYQGLASSPKVLGTATARFPDISRFSGLANRKLSGTANIVAKLDGAPKNGDVTVTLSGDADKLATSTPAFDRLTSGKLSLNGGIRALPGAKYLFDDLKLSGSHVVALASGNADSETADLAMQIDLPELNRADERLSGKAQVNARLYGALENLNADAKVSVSDARALGRPIPKLDLDAKVQDLQGALDTRATLAGTVDGKPAAGLIVAKRLADGAIDASSLSVSIGSVALNGRLNVSPGSLSNGRITLSARDLNDISPLVLTKLAGQLDADIVLSTPDGKQNLQAKASGAKLAVAGNAIDRLTLTADIADALNMPAINANAAIDRAVLGGETVNSIKLDAKGTQAASDISLSATARGFDLAAKGRLTPGTQTRFDLASFDARRDGRRIALANPASFTLSDGGVTIANFVLGVDSGRVSVDGKAGDRLDLKVAARAVPLSAARIFAPTLDLAGTLDAEAQVSGTGAAPSGPWKLSIANLVAPQTRSAGLPPISVSANGALAGDHTRVDATVTAGKIASLKVAGTAPLNATGPIDLTARGTVDAALANASLAAGGRRLTGTLAIDMHASGPASSPITSGSATFSNGSFSDALQGVQISGLQARVIANGKEVTIERASGTTRNGGTIAANGRVTVDANAGFPANIRIQGQRAELVSNGIVAAVADLGLDISGPLAQRPRIGGFVAVNSMDVRVPDRLPTTLRPVDGIKHIHPTKTVAARLASDKKAKQTAGRKGKRAPVFEAVLDLTVSAPNKIFVRGRGIDAELGGDLKVTGTSSDPNVVGAFDLRRGRLQVLGQRLDFTKGRLTFSGDVLPDLDFLAQTQAGDVTAMIAVTGSAAQPSFAFSSSPDLPQDEVLSRILFQKASGQLSAFQAIQLAQAAAQFAGGGGDDTFEGLRKSLGVDNLDVQLGASGGPTVGVSRYIGNNISVGAKTGVKPEESGVSVNIDVTKHLRLQAEGQANGAAAAGVGAEWEY